MEKKAHILIVDDDESTRKSLSLIFKKKGYETHTAGTGKEALAAAKGKRFDAALLDIRLPDIQGIELIKPLRQMHPDIAIIMATGYATLDTSVRALNEGAVGYITKPLNMDEVLAKVDDVQEKQRLVLENRKLHEEIWQSEERHRTITENMTDTVWVMDMNFKNTYISPSVLKTRGYTLDELNALPLDKNFTPQSFETVARIMAEELTPERLANKDITISRSMELEFYRKDGSTFWGDIVMTLVRDAEGRPKEIIGVGRDITERKRVEKVLRESEELFRNLFNHHAAIKLIIDPDTGQIVDANEAAVNFYGWPIERLKQMKIQDINTLPPEEIKREIDKARSLKRVRFEFRHRRADGSIRDVEVYSSKIVAKGRDLLHSIVHDITDKKMMEMQLLQTEKLSAMGTMISGVAHELNNPLTSIIGNAQLLEKRDIPDEIKSKLDVIIKESIRSSKIVAGLLSFAREHKPERKMININNTLMESLKLREYDLRVSNIEVQTLLSEDLPETSADAYQLHQVFINIINNARDALSDQDKGALAIRTYRKDDAILIEFEDNGPGIPDDYTNKIFDPFFTTKEAGKGTGLGLSMAYGIIKEHRGTIFVESKTGKGAKFIVMLPIVEDTEVIIEDLKTPAKVPHGVKTVLVVEDEASLRDLLAEALTEEGIFVEAASNGEQAIHLIGKRKFDAVISDIKMPGVGGKELYLYIQRHHPEMVEKIVFITGDVLSKDTLSFLQITSSRYIEKPFSVDALVVLLNDVIYPP